MCSYMAKLPDLLARLFGLEFSLVFVRKIVTCDVILQV